MNPNPVQPQYGGPYQPPPQQQGCWGRNWKWLVPTGCFGLIVLVVAAVAAIFFFAVSAVKSSEVYQFALERARSNPQVVEELGEPIKDGWLVYGSVEMGLGGHGRANFQIPISGPKKSGTIYAEALKDPQVGEDWYYTTLAVEVEGRPDRVDLRSRPHAPPEAGDEGDNSNVDAEPPPPPPPGSSSNRVPVSGGVLNGKAVSKPEPAYPPIAKAAKASGTVTVQVTVDEAGNVISATAISGHPLLQQAAVAAARQARFTPYKLNGSPVKVTGVLTYNFVPE
ncbi:MAG TPA: cytochrome c oxidase assembly factor Coa1 family protein [Pyrinomonadaceae bacterium]|jgi:TonB family protein|nr:cytochrome c oxidase assembly factor Coa1 family protein [Pyrinomonadaceae bacterium]